MIRVSVGLQLCNEVGSEKERESRKETGHKRGQDLKIE